MPYQFSRDGVPWAPPSIDPGSGKVDQQPLPTAVTLTAEHLTPQVLLDLAAEAAKRLRAIRGPEDRESWERAIGTGLRYMLRDVWHGKITDLYLATLAYAYLEVADRPFLVVMPTLAEMTGRSPNTVKMHLVRARDRGLLVGEPGKAGGELTAKAEALLAEHTTKTHPYG